MPCVYGGTLIILDNVLDCHCTGAIGFAATHRMGTAQAAAGGKLTIDWKNGPLHWAIRTKQGSFEQ
eukprot:COSAG02_NODE_71_length_42019_cov_36.443893_4_plen_66_part_00